MDIRRYKVMSNYAEFLWAKLLRILGKSFPDLIINKDYLFRSLTTIRTLIVVSPPPSEKQRFKILQLLVLLKEATDVAATQRQQYHNKHTLHNEDKGHKNARLIWNQLASEINNLYTSFEKSWSKKLPFVFQMPTPHSLFINKKTESKNQSKSKTTTIAKQSVILTDAIDEEIDFDYDIMENFVKMNQFKLQLEKIVYFIMDTEITELLNADSDKWNSDLWTKEQKYEHNRKLDGFVRGSANLILPQRISKVFIKSEKFCKEFKQMYLSEFQKLKSKSPPTKQILHNGTTIAFLFSPQMFNFFCASSLSKTIYKRLSDRVVLFARRNSLDVQSKELLIDWTKGMIIDLERENHPLGCIWVENEKTVLNFAKHFVSDLMHDGGSLADEAIMNLKIILTSAFRSFDCCLVPNLQKNLLLSQTISGQTVNQSFSKLFFHCLCYVIQFSFNFIKNATKIPASYLKGRKVWNVVAENPSWFKNTSLYILH